MAHRCGSNTRTYAPSGDGIDANQRTALLIAGREYVAALARCLGKLVAWSSRPCPGKCPLPVFEGITTTPEWVVGVQRPDGRWHVHVTKTMTATMKCLPVPKLRKSAKRAGRAAKKPRRAR